MTSRMTQTGKLLKAMSAADSETWFKPGKKQTEVEAVPITGCSLVDAMSPSNELFLFYFPENFDLEAIKGKSLALPRGAGATTEVEIGSELFNVSCSADVEFRKLVPVFPAGKDAGWAAGKPFTGCFCVKSKATATASGEGKPANAEEDEAAAENAEKDDGKSGKKKRKSTVVKRKTRVPQVPIVTIGDEVLGEESEENAEPPAKLTDLRRRWNAIGWVERKSGDGPVAKKKAKKDSQNDEAAKPPKTSRKSSKK